MGEKHLDFYLGEFSGKHNLRRLDTLQGMGHIARAIVGKRLPYEELAS